MKNPFRTPVCLTSSAIIAVLMFPGIVFTPSPFLVVARQQPVEMHSDEVPASIASVKEGNLILLSPDSTAGSARLRSVGDTFPW
eukprot:2034050-Pleurochrysis_carterae.AAC.3